MRWPAMAVLVALMIEAQSFGQRRYSPMRSEEVRQIVGPLISDRTLPRPDLNPLFPSWSQDQMEFHGVRIDREDFVLLALNKPGVGRLFPRGNLDKVFSDARTVETTNIDGKEHVACIVNGLLYSTVDLEVVNTFLFHRLKEEEPWTTMNRIVAKRGYVLCTCEMGIFLAPRGLELSFLAYRQPLPALPKSDDILFQPSFSISEQPRGIRIGLGEIMLK